MPQHSVLKASGLQRTNNAYQSVREGALRKADNCVIRSKDVVEPRRGQPVYGSFGGDVDPEINATKRANSIHFFGDEDPIVSYVQTADESYGLCSSDHEYAPEEFSGLTLTPTAYGTGEARPRLKSALIRDNLYIATSGGVGRLENLADSTVYWAGVPRALEPTNFAIGTAGGTIGKWLPVGSTAAYRAIWGYKDSHGAITWGHPSGRAFVTNATMGAGEVSFDVPVPDGITTSHILRVYRSESEPDPEIQPSDELFLTYENVYVSGEEMSVIDYQPDSLLDDPLPTNPNTGEPGGLRQANDRPPICRDIAAWDDRLWFANTQGLGTIPVRCLGFDDTYGVRDGDGVVFNNDGANAYTFKDMPSGDLDVQIDPSSSPALKLQGSIKNLIDAINANEDNDFVDAYYTSADDETPGKFVLVARNHGVEPFTFLPVRGGFVYDSGGDWQSSIGPIGSEGVGSLAEAEPEAIYFSKTNQPEAVPKYNRIRVGTRGKHIRRIVPLRDKLFVFKEEGVYVISQANPYRSDLLDDTIRLTAWDSVAVLGNMIFCLTRKGLISLTDAGATLVGGPIQDDLRRRGAGTEPWATAKESEGLYYLGTIDPDAASEEEGFEPSEVWVYCINTNAWTRWPVARQVGAVDVANDDQLYFGAATTNELRQENASLSLSGAVDLYDDALTVNIEINDDGSYEITPWGNVEVGDLLSQDNGDDGDAQGVIVSINNDAESVQVLGLGTFTASSAKVLKAYTCEVEWQVAVPAGPGELKQFSEVTLHFRDVSFYTAKLTAATDLETTVGEQTLKPTAGRAAPTGDTAEIDDDTPLEREGEDVLDRREICPRQRGSHLYVGFRIREAGSPWALTGYTAQYTDDSERNSA